MKQVIRITYTGNGVCDAMALLEKLIFTKRKLDDCHESRSHSRFSQITPEQVRLLLFKECDWRGRKLLFDSSTIERVVASKHDKPNVRQPEEVPCIVEVSEGFSYVYKGPAADARVLGEMIFGAVAMNYKSVSFKIHIMDDPRRLMCTKVFGVPTSRRISRERKSGASSGDLMLGSNPLNVPPREEGVSLSFSLGRGDSGICGDLSPYSSVGSTCDYFSMFNIWDGNQSQEDIYTFHSPPGRRLSNSSNGSFQRRASQNMATRFDLGSSSPKLLSVPTAASNVTSNDSQVYSNSTTSGTSDSLNSTASSSQKKNKLGLALLITVSDNDELDLVRSCVEHSPQLQALVCRLRLATLEAGAGAGFVSTLYRAGIDAAKSLSDLIYGPRLQPIWLHLVTSDRRTAVRTSETLLTDMCSVLSVGDTKHTNFFISTLLTHVLTYHLGWVSTVSPYDTVDGQNRPSDLEPGSKRPYNALWAQLSDLCGSIGFPPRIAKTIISGGNNAQFVNKLLVVLTYFVRCGKVKRNDYVYEDCDIKEAKVVNVQPKVGLKRIATQASQLGECKPQDSLQVPCSNTQNSFSSVSTLAPSDISVKRSPTLANFGEKLSLSSDCLPDCNRREDKPGLLRRNHTMLHSIKASSDSSLSSSTEEIEPEQRVLFVLGDDEKLVGLKNKSTNGKRVKKSSKVQEEPIGLEVPDKDVNKAKDRETESPSKCCGQTLQHSKPIKHSGFKFEFDKYPQIVTNYMKSKNLEILDRHYIGKPGNLKLDNFQFDPTIVPPIQEERCETCYQCQMMESLLQTPTNASEFEYMNDIPRQSEPQYAKETIVKDTDRHRELSPKNFVRKRKENTIVVNLKSPCPVKSSLSVVGCNEVRKMREKDNGVVEVKQLVEFPMPGLVSCQAAQKRSGFDSSLLGGVTDHYVPDLVLQGTLARPQSWDAELRRDLELTSYLNKTTDAGAQAVAIVGDTSTWEVSVVGRGCGAGMSSLVGAMLDALPAMRRARVPAHQCISFLEGKLRELCVLSKTLADMLMSTDFCDIATLTKSLNIDVNDVPLLLAVATTHTPQVATRYGISYR